MSAVAVKERAPGSPEKAKVRTVPFNEEAMAEGRKLGNEAEALNARERRTAWKELAVKAVVDNFHSNQFLRRSGIIENVHTDCRVLGMKGKGGFSIKKSTISKWLSEDVEDEIYMESIARVVSERLELAGLRQR